MGVQPEFLQIFHSTHDQAELFLHFGYLTRFKLRLGMTLTRFKFGFGKNGANQNAYRTSKVAIWVWYPKNTHPKHPNIP